MAKPDYVDVKSWPFARWPERDQKAWLRSTASPDPFDDDGLFGGHLRPTSLRKYREGHGRWLSFLAARGWLDSSADPIARVTIERLRAYFRALLRSRNGHLTVVGRFNELAMALKVLSPGSDTRWIRELDGLSVHVRLPAEQKPKRYLDVAELLDWGLNMMDDAQIGSGKTTDLLAYRDGLLIALLASRGRRNMSMASLDVDDNIFKDREHYRVEFGRRQVKTAKADHFNLRHDLTVYIDRYLDEVRPALLRGRQHAGFWVAQTGVRLTKKGLAERIHVLSRKRFGCAFGPHHFRHAIATSLATHAPSKPGLAASVLGITAEVVADHYDRANQMNAAATYAELIERRREQTVRKPVAD